MADRLHLQPKHRKVLEALLREHLPGVEVWAYGSRVSGKSHDGSDLDLVLRGPGLAEIPIGQLGDFEAAVRESTIPFLVEARDWTRLPERFHREIAQDHVVLMDGGEKTRDGEELVSSDEWHETTLGDLIDLTHGFAFKGEHISDEPNGDILLTPGNFAIGGGFKPDKYKYYRGPVSDDYILSEGDLIVSMTDLSKQSDTLGYPAFVPECRDGRRYLHNQRLGKVYIMDPDLKDRYIYYVMCGNEYRHEVLASATGTTVKHTSPNRIRQFRFQLAPPSEQHAIAHILGTLDDKIELNRRMNDTLEAMARALFKSWFVDFDPVRAKMEGCDAGLPQPLADLFPDRLVDSEIGEIPEGWSSYRMDDLADQHTRSVTPSNRPDEKFEHLSIPAYDTGQMPAVERGSEIKSNKTVVPLNSVLLSKLNPEIPRVWLPGASATGPQICSTEFLVFTSRHPSNRTLLFALFTNDEFRTLLRSMVTGTSKSHQRVPPKALRCRQVLSGTPSVFDRFGELISPVLKHVVANRVEAQTLAKLRDSLLPKLISGQIRATDCEHELEVSI